MRCRSGNGAGQTCADRVTNRSYYSRHTSWGLGSCIASETWTTRRSVSRGPGCPAEPLGRVLNATTDPGSATFNTRPNGSAGHRDLWKQTLALFTFLTQYMIPILMTCVCYSRICWSLCRRKFVAPLPTGTA